LPSFNGHSEDRSFVTNLGISGRIAAGECATSGAVRVRWGMWGIMICLIRSWREELYSFTIITTPANKLLRPIHDRMPLILDPDIAQQWLDPNSVDTRMISVWMVPFPSELMEVYEVSRLVNDPKNDSRMH
jgi:putative SOS response-associated peptidase YedK